MPEIKCPNCGTVISLEQSDIESVVKQVRDEEFEKDLAKRMELAEVDKARAVELAEAKVRSELAADASARETRIAELEAAAKAQSAQLAAQMEARIARLQSEKDAEIARLNAELGLRDESAVTRQKLAVAEAVAAIEKERDELRASVDLKEAEKARVEATLKEQLVEQSKAKDEVIAFQREEIERMKDMRARLTTKLVGERLEVHCADEFNSIRSTAFPNAVFERDTEAVEGTKGDFIFREEDDEGNEVISIMFEMKNEEDGSTRRTRNEDHLAKLDRDRTKKNCEYAVLVSLLEPESDLYNNGIVDMSWRYPKMYVIRPQFFIPIIALLRNAALGALEYKREIALMRRQELDITNFEHDLDVFKKGFFKNFGDASLRFEEAVKAIDKAIADLQKAKEKLLVSEKHLNAANNKLEGLSVKKLVRNNPTMKAKFDELE